MSLPAATPRWSLHIDRLSVQGVAAHQQAAWLAGLRVGLLEGLQALRPEQLQALGGATLRLDAPAHGSARERGRQAAQSLLGAGRKP